jgi:hypothetical protein
VSPIRPEELRFFLDLNFMKLNNRNLCRWE